MGKAQASPDPGDYSTVASWSEVVAHAHRNGHDGLEVERLLWLCKSERALLSKMFGLRATYFTGDIMYPGSLATTRRLHIAGHRWGEFVVSQGMLDSRGRSGTGGVIWASPSMAQWIDDVEDLYELSLRSHRGMALPHSMQILSEKNQGVIGRTLARWFRDERQLRRQTPVILQIKERDP